MVPEFKTVCAVCCMPTLKKLTPPPGFATFKINPLMLPAVKPAAVSSAAVYRIWVLPDFSFDFKTFGAAIKPAPTVYCDSEMIEFKTTFV